MPESDQGAAVGRDPFGDGLSTNRGQQRRQRPRNEEEDENPRERLRLKLIAAQEALELVRLCEAVPAQQRIWWQSPLLSRCEHVYLLWCGLRSAHKIGYSGRQHHERRGELESERSRKGLSQYGRLDTL